MADTMTVSEWATRFGELTNAAPWPEALTDTQTRWLLTIERMIADGVTPEQAASVVLESERLWLHGDPSSTVRPVGLINATR